MEQVQELVDFDSLSQSEKILRLQDLWDRITQNPQELELTDAQKAEIDRRIDAFESDPEAGKDWNSLKKEIPKKS